MRGLVALSGGFGAELRWGERTVADGGEKCGDFDNARCRHALRECNFAGPDQHRRQPDYLAGRRVQEQRRRSGE